METTKLFNVCLLDSNGNPSKIYIFSNGKKIEPNILFSETQINDFKLYNPEFIYVDQYIYKDDSIKIIKKKILKILEKNIDTITFEQLYLFSQTSLHYNVYNLFKTLSNGRNIIDNDKFQQFLLNINKKDNNKNSITIDDFLDLELPDKLDVFYPLGKDFSSYFDFLFSGNPFNVIDTNNPSFINENTNNTILTADNNLLFEYNLNSNVIYLSLIDDIFTYCSVNKLDEEYLISSEVKTLKKEIESVKTENNTLRKKILELNQRTNLFKLKKIIHKHTECDLNKLNKILEDNDITEDSFILNDINEKLIKKVIGLMDIKS